jgi:hypothetical protein
MLVLRRMRALTLNPILTLARARLNSEQARWSEAALHLASLMTPDAEDSIVAQCVEIIRCAVSDELAETLYPLLRAQGGPPAALARLAAPLREHGFAAAVAQAPAQALHLLGAYRILAAPPPELDERLLSALVRSATQLHDFGRRERYLPALIAYRRLPIAIAPATSPSVMADAGTDNPAEAAAILAARGMVLVRHLFDPARFPDLVSTFEAVNPNEFIAVRIARTPMEEPARALVPDYLNRLIRALLAAEPVFQPEFSFMRGLKPGQHRMVPYHQDMNNFETELVNCWVPLTPCPDTAPRLEIVAERIEDLLDTGMSTGDFRWIDQAVVHQRFPAESIVAPPVDLGDAILLLGSTIHRTFATAEMVDKRFSIELRFKAA